MRQLSVLLLCTALNVVWLPQQTAGTVGLWGTCSGRTPTTVFRGPSGFVPAWHGGHWRIGRANPPFYNDGGCKAYFARGNEKSVTTFQLLLKVSAANKGYAYAWIRMDEFHSNRQHYIAVKYDESAPFLSCFFEGVRVKTCDENYIHKNMLGMCDDNGSGIGWTTYCNYEFKHYYDYTKDHVYVLVANSVARISLDIRSIGTITHNRVVSEILRMQFEDHELERGQTHLFEGGYAKTTKSHFTTGVGGWRTNTNHYVHGALIEHELRQWLTQKEMTLDGFISTCCRVDRISKSNYQHTFVGNPGHKTDIEIPINRDSFTVEYTGIETGKDKQGKTLYQKEVRGTWTGAATHPGEPVFTTIN